MKRTRLNPAFCLLFAGLLAALPPSLAAESPWDILSRSRNAATAAESARILESGLAGAGNLAPRYLLDLARLSGEQGDWQRCLRWSLAQDTQNLPADIADAVYWWRGRALEETGKVREAESLLRERIASGLVADPSLYLAYYRVAQSGAEKAGTRFDASFPRLQKTDPRTWALSRYLAGIVAVRSGEWSYASAMFAQYASAGTGLFPEYDPWSRYYLAWCQYRLGRWTEAVAGFSAYLDGWLNHPAAWQAATAAALSALQTDIDPLPFAERAVRLAPDVSVKAESVLLQASILVDRKRYPAAEALLAGISDGTSTNGLTPSAARALFMLADVAMREKDNALAEKRWLSLASLFPKDPLAGEAVYRSAELAFIAADWAHAAESFAKYRQSWPTGPYLDIALRSGGTAWLNAGNPDLAILWWDELIRKFPGSPYAARALADLVSACRSRKDWSSARRYAEQYRSLFPAEAKLDAMDREIEELTRLERGESADTAALFTAWTRQGRAATPAGRDTALRLARLYLADYSTRETARAILREVASQIPRKPETLSVADRNTCAASLTLLGNLLREDADFDGASEYLLSAGTLYAPIDGERSAEALYGAADSFLQAGKRADARKTVETLAKTWPNSVWTRRAAILME